MTKLFISHAWEDKADLVEPLVRALGEEPDFEVWYDKHSLTMGDGLREKISQGLRECDYGVVVLSKYFFAKKWPQNELDGLLELETAQRKLILPIWKNVTREDIMAFSPILGSRLGVQASEGVTALVSEIRRAVQAGDRVASFSPWDSLAAKFHSLGKDLEHEAKANKLSSSKEGVALVESSAKDVIDMMASRLNQLASGTSSLEFRIVKGNDTIEIDCPLRIQACGQYSNPSWYGVSKASLNFKVSKDKGFSGASRRDPITLSNLEARCWFGPDNEVVWRIGTDCVLSSEQLAMRFIDDLITAIDKARPR